MDPFGLTLKTKADKGVQFEPLRNSFKCIILVRRYFEEKKYDKCKEMLDYLLEFSEDGSQIFDDDLQIEVWFLLGVLYYDGLGTLMEMKKGIDFMHRIADLHTYPPNTEPYLRRSQYNLGWAYYMGKGVHTDDRLAEYYWILAANEGGPLPESVDAQKVLGKFFSRKSVTDAFQWFIKGLENKDTDCAAYIGIMYMYGLGVHMNSDVALDCLAYSATRGHVLASGHLIAFYYSRKMFRIAIDLAERLAAVDDVQKAARLTKSSEASVEQGICMACFYLARCLQMGRGVKKDLLRSDKMYQKAVNLSSEVCFVLHQKLAHSVI